jgi:hypothetical protein
MPQCAVVNFSPPGGSYTVSNGEFGLRAETPTGGASIAWTNDGTIPVPRGHGHQSGSVFGDVFRGDNQTITKTYKAIAYKDGYLDSAMVTVVYVVTFTPITPPPRPLSPPTFTPPNGSNLTFPFTVNVAVGANGQFIIYTENDGNPSFLNGVQTPGGTIAITLNADTVLRAVSARHDQTEVSGIRVGNYTGGAAALEPPVLTPPGGVNINFPLQVVISSNNNSALIIYTLNDNMPPSWMHGTRGLPGQPVTLTLMQNTTIRAIAAIDETNVSNVSTGVYTGSTSQLPPPPSFAGEGDVIVVVSDQDTVFGGVLILPPPTFGPATPPMPPPPPILISSTTPSGMMIYHPEIVSLTGAPPSMQTLPSAPLAIGTLIKITIGTEEQSWRVDLGPADTSDPGQIAPFDYDSLLNNKHYQKVI